MLVFGKNQSHYFNTDPSVDKDIKFKKFVLSFDEKIGKMIRET